MTSYLLWLLLGVVGAHRFYLGMKPSGGVMLCLACVVGVTLALRGFGDEALLMASIVGGGWRPGYCRTRSVYPASCGITTTG